MDLKAQMGQFLAPKFTLAQLAENLFQAETDPDRVVMRQWIYGEEETCRELTRAQVNNRIKMVAARLQQVAEPGTRVAILAGNSPEYVFGFLGALYAGMVPIPLYDPNEPGHSDHLKAVRPLGGPSAPVRWGHTAESAPCPHKEHPRSRRRIPVNYQPRWPHGYQALPPAAGARPPS